MRYCACVLPISSSACLNSERLSFSVRCDGHRIEPDDDITFLDGHAVLGELENLEIAATGGGHGQRHRTHRLHLAAHLQVVDELAFDDGRGRHIDRVPPGRTRRSTPAMATTIARPATEAMIVRLLPRHMSLHRHSRLETGRDNHFVIVHRAERDRSRPGVVRRPALAP